MTLFRALKAVLLCLGLLTSAGAGAQAQANGKPITIVVPFPPGAGPDLVARTIGEKLAARLNRAVVVENKPGAGGLVGATQVARAPADGATLLLAPNTLVISPHVLAPGAAGGIDVLKELAPVAPLGTTPMLLVAHPQAGVRDVAGLLTAAKAKPGLAFGSAGNGSPMHFAGALLMRSAGLNLLHVPYRGVAPSVTAAIGGEVPLLFVALGGVTQHLQSGKLVPVALAEKARSPLLPDVPTFREGGVAQVEVNAWYGVFAPAGIAADAVQKLNAEINAVLQMADVKARLGGAGIELNGGTPQALGAMANADFERYGRVARELGIRAD